MLCQALCLELFSISYKPLRRPVLKTYLLVLYLYYCTSSCKIHKLNKIMLKSADVDAQDSCIKTLWHIVLVRILYNLTKISRYKRQVCKSRVSQSPQSGGQIKILKLLSKHFMIHSIVCALLVVLGMF